MDLSDLQVKNEISENQVDQLIEFTTKDPDISKFTSDLKRFPDKDSFKNWQGDKFIYTLSDKENNLLGIIWFEKKLLPEEVLITNSILKNYKLTIAMRIYADARGKGYFRAFLKEVLEQFKKLNEYQLSDSTGFWVSIAKENIASQMAFSKYGFEKISTNAKRVFMVL